MSDFHSKQLDKIWEQTLKLIRESSALDEVTFSTWFQDGSKLYDIKDNLAIVTVPFKLNKDILTEHLELIKEKLAMVTDQKFDCQIMLHKDVETFSTTRRNKVLLEDKINKEYTFDNFVVGKNNREAHAAALSICYYPGKFYNPLFIYGNSGLGKTHLLHAIGNYVKKTRPDAYVLYIYSEDFVTMLIEAMKNKTVEEVKERICAADYLLIDDIQRLTQNTSQEIFFNLYNKLVSDHKQIVITSDMHPEELKGIENRLISRFSGGLPVSIDSPEFETAKAILKKKIEGRDQDILIEDQVLDFLASRFSTDVRKLEGALNELFFKSIIYNPESINLVFAHEIFRDNPISKSKDAIDVDHIKKTVCEYYGLTVAQIESKSRTKNIANARHIAIYLCRKHLHMPYTKIGFAFGNRDHSTVMTSCEKMNKFLKDNEMFKKAVFQIEEHLGVV